MTHRALLSIIFSNIMIYHDIQISDKTQYSLLKTHTSTENHTTKLRLLIPTFFDLVLINLYTHILKF